MIVFVIVCMILCFLGVLFTWFLTRSPELEEERRYFDDDQDSSSSDFSSIEGSSIDSPNQDTRCESTLQSKCCRSTQRCLRRYFCCELIKSQAESCLMLLWSSLCTSFCFPTTISFQGYDYGKASSETRDPKLVIMNCYLNLAIFLASYSIGSVGTTLRYVKRARSESIFFQSWPRRLVVALLHLSCALGIAITAR